jgi:hypothetical protein
MLFLLVVGTGERVACAASTIPFRGANGDNRDASVGLLLWISGCVASVG